MSNLVESPQSDLATTVPALPSSPPLRRWPGPSYPAGPLVWLGALVVGVTTAVALPFDTGIGWLLIGVVFAAVLGHAGRFTLRSLPVGERFVRLAWAAAALALLSVGTWRSAGWVFVLCFGAALVSATLAVVGGQSIRAISYAGLITPIAGLRAIPWLLRGARATQVARRSALTGAAGPAALQQAASGPAADSPAGTAPAGIPAVGPRTAQGGRIVVAGLVTVLLLVIFTALLASADAAFAELVEGLVPTLRPETFLRAIFLVPAGLLAAAAAVFLVLAPPTLSGMDSPARSRIGRIELILPLGTLTLLFAVFVAVQLPFLFGDGSLVERTTGLTYAAYAVQGFGQLVVVTILTLAIVGVASRWAHREQRTDRVVLRALLGGLALLSLVIVASALKRMYLYQSTYGFTRERLFFGAVELLLGLVFVLVLVAGVRLRAGWLPRTVLGLSVAMLLGMSALNPEAVIAERNIHRFEVTGNIDIWYLRALSADAVPALLELPEPYRSCGLQLVKQDLEGETDSWREWNSSRQAARELLRTLPRPEYGACQFAYRD